MFTSYTINSTNAILTGIRKNVRDINPSFVDLNYVDLKVHGRSNPDVQKPFASSHHPACKQLLPQTVVDIIEI